MTFIRVVFATLSDSTRVVEFVTLVVFVAVPLFTVVPFGAGAGAGATGCGALVQLERITATPMLAGSPAAPSLATSGWGVVLFASKETAFLAIDMTSVKSSGSDEEEGGEVGGGRDVLENTE